ncbi:MAG TPA: GFA family protein [Caulobacteraceae bacterium]|nr:GFA family protein [Caulobacteraceae bacterium]
MSANQTMTGQCLCGRVTFELLGPLGTTTHCHCRSCRLSRGVAFVTWTSVPNDRFRVVSGEDDIAWHRSSPQVRWGFCRRCGSQMFYVADHGGHPETPLLDHVYVSAGALDDGAHVRPEAHVSWEEHLAWIEGVEMLPRFRGKTVERTDCSVASTPPPGL